VGWTLGCVADETPLLLDVLRAAGPFVAAVVALYIALWSERRERRRQPDLRLLFDPATDDVEAGVDEGKDEKHWVRLRVANRWGKRTAEDVEVLVIDVRPRFGPSLSGFRLAWATLVEDDYRWPTSPWPARQTIASGTALHVDLLYMALQPDGESRDPIEGIAPAYIALQARPERRDERHVLPAGEWYLLLALTSRNADTVYYGVTIDFDGLWWSSEHMRDHLNVSVSRVHYVVFAPERAWRRGFVRRLRIRA
jgi:hypothetical protein